MTHSAHPRRFDRPVEIVPQDGTGITRTDGPIMAFDYKLDFIRSRYGRIARIYPLLELIFLPPRGIRSRTGQRLEPIRGDRMLEVDCGTGRNFGHLVEAVGSEGKVYAVDCCQAMLAKAGRLCKQAGWINVELLHQDAADLRLPELVAGVLFSCLTL